MTYNSNNSKEFLQKLTQITEANLQNEHFGVSDLARKMGMSRSSLHRKVQAQLKISVSRFIRQKRLEKGLELLRQSPLTVSEVAYNVGFSSVTYFIKCFHDYYGYSPGEAESRSEPKNDEKVNSEGNKNRKKWLISAAFAVLFIIVVLFIAEVNPLQPEQNPTSKSTQKSLAVLPLQFEGSDSMKLIAGGLRGSILNRLMEIENLIIRSETSVEQYRESIKSLKEIAKELDVDYIIEMKGFQSGKDIRLQVSLTDAVNDEYIWRAGYPIDVNDRNSLDLPNRIAREILKYTNTEISTQERELLQEPLSDNQGALNYYLQALQHLSIYNQTLTFSNLSYKELLNAKEKLYKAIMLDSTFSAAYVRLGSIYIDVIQHNTNNEFLKNAYLDSGLQLAKKALSLYKSLPKDRNFRWAMGLVSNYYYYKGDLSKSKEINEERQKFTIAKNEKYFEGELFKHWAYENYYECIKNFFSYSEIISNNEIIRPTIYKALYNSLYYTGFPKVAKKYLQECLASTGDTLHYYFRLSYGHICTGNFMESINFAHKILEQDSSLVSPLHYLTYSHIYLIQYQEALEYVEALEKAGQDVSPEVLGFVYQKTGNEQKTSRYFANAVKKYLHQINSHTLQAAKYNSHFQLAWTYSALGEKEEALRYLKEVKNRTTIPYWMITCIEDWPLFDNIRNEPEFQKLKKEFEKKYQKEHDRVAKLLQEKEEIPLL